MQREAEQLRREIEQLKQQRGEGDRPEREGQLQPIRRDTGRKDGEAGVAKDGGGARISVATPQDRQTSTQSTPRTGRPSLNLTTDSLTQDDVRQGLQKAVRFFHGQVAHGGGYLWQYSGDLVLREAEGRINDSRVWVQPPGTPTIGEAFLDAYEATGEKEILDAALEAAAVLVEGQMQTGGWGYSVERDPARRSQYAYRGSQAVKVTRWNRATVLDDDNTQAAVRFLARMDKALQFKDPKIHDAVVYALDAILEYQYPNGSWFGWWEWEHRPPNPAEHPVRKAAYPDTWPRKPEGWPARYVLNDDVVSDVVRTLLDVWEIYREPRYLAAAKKGADFLLLAQMPDPQPAWAQQYDVNMYPCWGRKFEPPAITGLESQTVLETLLMVYRRTGDKKYLEAVPRALEYLKKSRLPDGNLARFYELKTNRPLYFTRDYQLTYSGDDTPTHYGFVFESRLDAIEAEYRRLAAADPASLAAVEKMDRRKLAGQAVTILKWMDDRGAWIEDGWLRFHKVAPPSGVIKCQTFADNVKALCQFLAAKE